MAVSWIAFAALAATAFGGLTPQSEPLEKSSCGRVWLTVHSPAIERLGEPKLLDALELNWDFDQCSLVPDRVGLFNARPTEWINALLIVTIKNTSGFHITNVTLGDANLPAGWNKGPGIKGAHCLWPWIAAGNDEIEAYNCLKIQPTWMEDNAEILNILEIGELVIPGSHNAGAWRFNTELSSVRRDNFVLCQDRSLWAQLVHGIRYLDFRVAYYDYYEKNDDRYWLNHNLIRVRPLVPLLQEIRLFLDHTNEVIFLDFHHFPMGFYNQDGTPIKHIHMALLDIVQRELGPHLARANDFLEEGTKGPKLEVLIQAETRLIFSYVDNVITSENKWVWPSIPHLWANTNRPTDLFSYLDQAIAISSLPNARSPLRSAMAQTTPTVLDILFLRGSLRENADAVNRNVTSRLKKRWRSHANIVSTDFFLSNDVIDVAIQISKERAAQL